MSCVVPLVGLVGKRAGRHVTDECSLAVPPRFVLVPFQSSQDNGDSRRGGWRHYLSALSLVTRGAACRSRAPPPCLPLVCCRLLLDWPGKSRQLQGEPSRRLFR